MILSYKYKYILLEPTLTMSEYAYSFFAGSGFIDKDDIATGVYDGRHFNPSFKPQNCDQLYQSVDDYEKAHGDKRISGQRIFRHKKELFLGYIWKATTLQDILDLGLLDSFEGYRIFMPIRNPVDRYQQAMLQSFNRRKVLSFYQDYCEEQLINTETGEYSYLHTMWLSQDDMLVDGVDVTYFLFDNLYEDVALLFSKLGSAANLFEPAVLGELPLVGTMKDLPNTVVDKIKTDYVKDYTLWENEYNSRSI